MPTKKSADELWADQAVAEFGDGRIVAGVDYLKQDFTKIDGVPDHLVSCWAPEDEDLGRFQYFKADPQPINHEMVRRKQVLWLTRRDIYEKRKEMEREVFRARSEAAEADPDKIDKGALEQRDGRRSMAPGG